MAIESWSAQQLAEFLGAVSGLDDEGTMLCRAAERAASAFEAEVGAVVRDQRLLASAGYSPGHEPVEELVGAAAGRRCTVEVPGAGACPALAVPFDDGGPSHLVLARSGGEGFDPHEACLLRAMAQVLGLTLSSLRRQTMLERLARSQRSISHRAPLGEVLDAITEGAAELVGEEVVALRLLDPDEPSTMVMVSSVGLTAEQRTATYRVGRDQGVGGQTFKARPAGRGGPLRRGGQLPAPLRGGRDPGGHGVARSRGRQGGGQPVAGLLQGGPDLHHR